MNFSIIVSPTEKNSYLKATSKLSLIKVSNIFMKAMDFLSNFFNTAIKTSPEFFSTENSNEFSPSYQRILSRFLKLSLKI